MAELVSPRGGRLLRGSDLQQFSPLFADMQRSFAAANRRELDAIHSGGFDRHSPAHRQAAFLLFLPRLKGLSAAQLHWQYDLFTTACTGSWLAAIKLSGHSPQYMLWYYSMKRLGTAKGAEQQKKAIEVLLAIIQGEAPWVTGCLIDPPEARIAVARQLAERTGRANWAARALQLDPTQRQQLRQSLSTSHGELTLELLRSGSCEPSSVYLANSLAGLHCGLDVEAALEALTQGVLTREERKVAIAVAAAHHPLEASRFFESSDVFPQTTALYFADFTSEADVALRPMVDMPTASSPERVALPDAPIARLALFLRSLAWSEKQQQSLLSLAATWPVEHQQTAYCQSLQAIALLAQTLSPELPEWLTSPAADRLLADLGRTRVHGVRASLAADLLRFCADAGGRAGMQTRPKMGIESYFEGRLVGRLLLLLEFEGIGVAPLRHTLNTSAHATFKDGPKLRALLALLQLVLHDQQLTQATKSRLLVELAASPSGRAVHARVNDALLLYAVARHTELEVGEASVAAKADEVMAGFLGEVGGAEAKDRFFATFGKSRAARAIWSYVARLETLNDPAVKKSLAEYIQQVCNGTFASLRASSSHNHHLQTLAKQRADFLPNWFSALPSRPAQRWQTQAEAWSARSWLRSKLLDHDHLAGQLSEMPALRAQLEAADDTAELREARDAAQKRLMSAEPTPLEDVERSCLALLDAPDENAAKPVVERLRVAVGCLGPQQAFAFDVAELLAPRPVALSEAEAAKMVLVDSDDPFDLLLCGTEVAGSCQRVDGAAALNKGLLGTLLNGQTRLLAVKNKATGKIVSRTLLRALTDGKGPVLFVELLYGDRSYANALVAFAKAKAEAVGVPLTSAYVTGQKYPTKLRSVGGRAPFEYCDGSDAWINKLSPQSVFTIGKAWVMD